MMEPGKQPRSDPRAPSTPGAGALSPAAVERRIILRESEFWKNTVKEQSSNNGTVPRRYATDPGRLYSFLHSSRNSKGIDFLFAGVFRQLCLVKGEACLGVAHGSNGGRDFLLTNYRIIEWRVPQNEPGVIIPLEAVRSYESAEGRLEYLSEQGTLLTLDAPVKFGDDRLFPGVSIDSALAARAWKSLDAVSRRILARSRADLSGEMRFSPQKIVRMVPAIRRGKLRFAHETEAKVWGVCAGIANELCLPAVAVRAGFVILVPLIGIGLVLYLVVGLAMTVVSAFAGDTRHSYEDADSAGCPIA